MSSQKENALEQLQQIQNNKAQSFGKVKIETTEIQVQNIKLLNDIEMSKLKIDTMLEKARGLERRNLELNNKVTELVSNIREVKNIRIQNLTTFGSEMNNIKSRMQNLELDPQEYSGSANSNLEQGDELNNDASNSNNFSMEEKEAILKMFKEERANLVNMLQALQERKEQLEAEVQTLTSQ